MKENLIFIGMPAVGKSTVGIVVAKRLGMNFIDSDLLIQEQEGKLLREIIAEVGDDGFLKIENQVNRDIQCENAVISPGGSVIYCEEAMEHFKEIGKIVYLKEGQTLKNLYDERVGYFEKYADITIDEDGCQIEETIDNVIRAVEGEA